MKTCCEEFAKAIAEDGRDLSPLAISYSLSGIQLVGGKIEFSGSEWNIPGCCGGGCWVLTDIKFCPFCGAKLEAPDSPSS